MHVASPPMGSQLLVVDASQATADASDALAGFALRIDVPGGVSSLSTPIVLPDFAAGDRQTFAIGALGSTETLAQGGATLTLTTGTTIARGAATGNVELSVSTVDDFELPPVPLPLDPGTTLVSRGAWVLPLDVTFGAGARLEARQRPRAAAFGQRAALALLGRERRVDARGQRFARVGAPAHRRRSAARRRALRRSARASRARRRSRGYVVDGEDVRISGALVGTAGGIFVRAGGDGSFSLGPIPAVDGGGVAPHGSAADQRALHARAAPARTARSRPRSRSTSSGKSTLAARPCGQLRVLLAQRGRALPGRTIAIGSTETMRAFAT